jgi:hypothetical protein
MNSHVLKVIIDPVTKVLRMCSLKKVAECI